ncbi:hypothetical protein [Streptomyces sp. NPDC051776]|uniref:hypothetical protein n=1 Tax=Streptomyces sp. NPDC051776 TaxID=3155414 RepID=UPI00343943A7
MSSTAAGVLLAATFNPGGDGNTLLGILAWIASAAGVGGVITVGIRMALQLHRGSFDGDHQHIRHLLIILGACVLAATAGPLVQFLGPLGLLD